MPRRRSRSVLAALVFVVCLLLVPAVNAAADDVPPVASPDVATATPVATGCPTGAPLLATPLPVVPSSPQEKPFQPAESLQVPDDGLRLTTASCKCLLSQVGEPCYCFGCAYAGNCVTLAGRPTCLTICAD